MDNFRTSNTNLYMRQSSVSQDVEHVKSIAEERVEYEQVARWLSKICYISGCRLKSERRKE